MSNSYVKKKDISFVALNNKLPFILYSIEVTSLNCPGKLIIQTPLNKS